MIASSDRFCRARDLSEYPGWCFLQKRCSLQKKLNLTGGMLRVTRQRLQQQVSVFATKSASLAIQSIAGCDGLTMS